MAFTLKEFGEQHRYLWHLTHPQNVALLRQSRQLLPSALLEPDATRHVRRVKDVVPGRPVLREQDLVHESCVEFEDGWTMAEYLAALAERVFFWSGTEDGPKRAGRRAANRYPDDAVLRVPFLDLVQEHQPWFTRCNSGATRMQPRRSSPAAPLRGERVRRGPRTFRRAEECDWSPAEVVEVTFVGAVALPRSTEVRRRSLDWEPL